MSDEFIAFKLEAEPSYEELVYVGGQIKQSLKLTLEQAIYAMMRYVVKHSQDHFNRVFWACLEQKHLNNVIK